MWSSSRQMAVDVLFWLSRIYSFVCAYIRPLIIDVTLLCANYSYTGTCRALVLAYVIYCVFESVSIHNRYLVNGRPPFSKSIEATRFISRRCLFEVF